MSENADRLKNFICTFPFDDEEDGYKVPFNEYYEFINDFSDKDLREPFGLDYKLKNFVVRINGAPDDLKTREDIFTYVLSKIPDEKLDQIESRFRISIPKKNSDKDNNRDACDIPDSDYRVVFNNAYPQEWLAFIGYVLKFCLFDDDIIGSYIIFKKTYIEEK